MGMTKKPSGSIYPQSGAHTITSPYPDPARFQIEAYERVNHGLIVSIVYPNCTTYEGRKVLVFAHATIESVLHAPTIDPHFSDVVPEGTFTPVARFEPTDRGWKLARICAAAI